MGVVDYLSAAPKAERRGAWSNLGGENLVVDTPLELALFSYYAQSRIDIRPVAADAILPKSDPALADKKLGAAVLQELQILRFLGNTAAVGRYEGMLKFITDRGHVSRTQIEGFYRQNVGAYVAEIVDAEYKTEQWGYVLADVYAGFKAKGLTKGVDMLQLIKDTLTAFFTEPNKKNYEAVIGITARLRNAPGSLTGGTFPAMALDKYAVTLGLLSAELNNKVYREVSANFNALARIPADPKYDVFYLEYDTYGATIGR
jgi:hypothetical protein